MESTRDCTTETERISDIFKDIVDIRKTEVWDI